MPARANAARVGELLHSASIHFLRRVAREDEASGLSPARFRALSVVVDRGPLSLGALADAERVRPPTMTGIVAALEGDGLIRRSASASDGRVTELRATPKGVRALARARARRLALVHASLAALSRAPISPRWSGQPR